MKPATIELASAFGREGVVAIPIERRPRYPQVGRRPFPVVDLRGQRGTEKEESRLQDDLAWLAELYAQDLPLRDFTLLCADDVVVLRGSVWHRGAPIEGTLPPKQGRKPETLPKWAAKIERQGADAPRLTGRSAIIHAAGYRNYFHWTIEIMPRLFALREAMRQGSVKLDRILFFYDEPFRFVAESIAALLPDLQPMIEVMPAQLTRLDHCCFFVDATPEADYQDHRTHTSRLKICTGFLAEAVDERLASQPAQPGRAILVSRADAPKRALLNEELLLDIFADRGLERVALGNLSVGEQIAVMGQADLVVGAHGAGLTNIVYCRPGTTVIEVNSPDYIRRCRSFADIAMYRRLRYGLVVADGVPAPASNEGRGDPDIRIDPSAADGLRALAGRLSEVTFSAVA
jgi:capsular polysaccharide biosynthesis protein